MLYGSTAMHFRSVGLFSDHFTTNILPCRIIDINFIIKVEAYMASGQNPLLGGGQSHLKLKAFYHSEV